MFSTNVCTLISSSLSYIYKFEYNFFRDHTKYSKKTFYTHMNMNACFYNLYRQSPQSKLHFHIFLFSIPMNILFAEEKEKEKQLEGKTNHSLILSIDPQLRDIFRNRKKYTYIEWNIYVLLIYIFLHPPSRPHYLLIYF